MREGSERQRERKGGRERRECVPKRLREVEVRRLQASRSIVRKAHGEGDAFGGRHAERSFLVVPRPHSSCEEDQNTESHICNWIRGERKVVGLRREQYAKVSVLSGAF